MKTIEALCTSDKMKRILDRSQDCSDLIPEVLDHWTYDLYKRKPRIGMTDERCIGTNGQGHVTNCTCPKTTDLDLACFMSALAQRKAVINIPTYEGRRPKTRNSTEHVVSPFDRHGQVLGLFANKYVFSFSVRILDMNVLKHGGNGDRLGAPRTFMLVDIDGQWHNGWRSIEFWPSAKENDWLTDKKIWPSSKIEFSCFVHPNRWTSFYGQHYLMTKILIARLEEENQWRRQEQRKLLAAGVRFPVVERVGDSGIVTTSDSADVEQVEVQRDSGKRETVKAFECQVDAPFVNQYFHVPHTSIGLYKNALAIQETSFRILPQLRFATRTVEYAFTESYRYLLMNPFGKNQWQVGFKSKGKRTQWNRLVVYGEKDKTFALRTRFFDKVERVRAYEEEVSP